MHSKQHCYCMLHQLYTACTSQCLPLYRHASMSSKHATLPLETHLMKKASAVQLVIGLLLSPTLPQHMHRQLESSRKLCARARCNMRLIRRAFIASLGLSRGCTSAVNMCSNYTYPADVATPNRGLTHEQDQHEAAFQQ